MPRRINFEEDAVPFRRGTTDYIETSVGRRAIRTFSGADGSWKLSNLGKRFFKSNALPEVVLRIPCVFLTTKKNGQELRHLGWFHYELLDEGLRTQLTQLYLPGPHAPDRARRIQALKENLDNRRDAATGRIVLHFESDQLILLDESGRDWEFSFMTTHVNGDSEVDLDAFWNTILRGLPVNS